jgi:chitinase
MRLPSAAFFASTLLAASVHARFVIYADEWHPTRPTNPQDRAGIDHVVLAFAQANATAAFQQSSGPSVSTIRSEFPNAKVMIAVGGWGDDRGFFQVSQTDASIQAFAADVATMLTNTGADGAGEDYIPWKSHVDHER